MARVFSFPNPVNEKAARCVAIGVVALGVIYLVTSWTPLLFILAFGFLARVAAGPRFSPLGQLATRVIAPRLGEARLVPGPPKRFAQTIGLLVSGVGLGLALGNLHGAARISIAVLVVAASLEGFFGYCLGCKLFNLGIRTGMVPEQSCRECSDISRRHADLNPT